MRWNIFDPLGFVWMKSKEQVYTRESRHLMMNSVVLVLVDEYENGDR
jgi:hypothetical protein